MHMTSQKGAPVVLGVKRGTPRAPSPSMHALRGQTPACLTAELARVRTLTERVSANALCQQNMCAQRDKSWPPAWRRCYGDVTSMHKVYCLKLCWVVAGCAKLILVALAIARLEVVVQFGPTRANSVHCGTTLVKVGRWSLLFLCIFKTNLLDFKPRCAKLDWFTPRIHHVWLLTPGTAQLTLLPFKIKILLQQTE